MGTKEMIFEEVSKLAEDDAEKLYALIRLLFTKKEETLTDSQKAFRELESLKKKFSPPVDDDKEEYIRYLEEKYENLG